MGLQRVGFCCELVSCASTDDVQACRGIGIHDRIFVRSVGHIEHVSLGAVSLMMVVGELPTYSYIGQQIEVISHRLGGFVGMQFRGVQAPEKERERESMYESV